MVAVVSGQSVGVYLSLNGDTISNNGEVFFSDIGTEDSGLLCITNRSGCCRSSDAADGVAQGQWYRPNGTRVGTFGLESAIDPMDHFYRDRGTRVVRLNRVGNPPERGRFRCEVPNADGDLVNLYVNIIVDPPPTISPPVTVTVSPITSSGTATAGESYSLECTVTVTGSTNQPTITWLMGPMDNMITVVTTGSMSTLTFNPLAASDAGTYTCRATLGSVMDSASTIITVQTPTITVRVTSSVVTPMVGSMYSLTCTITGAEGLTESDAGAVVIYQWLKNGAVVSGQTIATLSFSPLIFSDAGSYTCQATVTSSLLSGPITTTPSTSLSVRLILPRPVVIRISTNQVNPLMVRPVGSSVTLTCMADLDPAIDVPVTVNIELSGPAGSLLTATTPSVSGSTYSSMATISTFGRNNSGLYTCSVTVSPSPPNSFLSGGGSQSQTLRVTTGVYLSLRGTVYANNDVIPIIEIGTTSNTGLHCITDRMPCCAGAQIGQWNFPNGTHVPMQSNAATFYQNRGGDGTVNLNRFNTNVLMPTGLFCCEVPDAVSDVQRLCTNITTSINVRITGSVATPALGGSYSLTCEVTGASGPVSAYVYQWRRDDTVISEIGQTLSFSSLSLSDAGQYTCQISVDGVMLSSPPQDIRLIIPPPLSVSVTSTPSSPVYYVTSSVTVTCAVELNSAVLESDLSLLMVSAQLTHPNGTILSLANTTRGITFTYTTQINSFRRSDSGNYLCTATVSPLPSNSFLSGGGSQSGTLEVAVGVYLSLRGVVYANNSVFQITEIGETNATSNTGLQCITDKMLCCATFGSRFGEWYFPDGTFVPAQGGATTFYRSRGDDGTVNLNRLNTNVLMPTGLFCCEVPDASGRTQRLCASIESSVSVRITGSVATPAVGQSYSLTCEVTRASGPVSAYQWRKDGAAVSTGPTLSFSPLTLSDAGQYTCQVSVDGMMVNSPPQDIRLTIPPPLSVSVTSTPSSPINDITSTVAVNCVVELGPSVMESELSLLMVDTQLSRDGTPLPLTGPTVSGTTLTYIRQFETFRRSDSGNYTCTATIGPQPTSTYLSGIIVLSNTIKLTARIMIQVNFQLIDKESMNISFFLTCNSTGVQASGVVWTRDGFLLDNTNPLVVTDASTLSYSNILMVSGRTPGTYICTIRGTSDQDLGSANFIVQVSSPPLNVRATRSGSSAPVEVRWSPPSDGANTITGYRIYYGNGQNLLIPLYVTSMVLSFIESSQVGSVSIRSESTQLPSDLIIAIMILAVEDMSSESSRTCSSDVGIAVGVLILVEGIIAAVAAIIVTVICWRRKSGKSDFAVSANMAYGQVRLGGLGDAGGEYEDPDKLARSGRDGEGGGGNYESTRYPAPYEFPVSKPEAPV